MRELYGQGCKCSSEYPGGGAQAPDDSIKRETGSQPEGLRKNRGARGDSLLMLSPIGLSNRKPPLLSISESGGSMSLYNWQVSATIASVKGSSGTAVMPI